MSLSELLANYKVNANHRWDICPKALDRWNPGIQAADTSDNDIGIFDVIGDDYWGEGVTAKRISAALRSIGRENPVTVNINSPGGDLFEGLTIYSLLREHPGDVTVNIMGVAASAASVVAMAATPGLLRIARAGFYMVHNSWSVSVGDRHDHREFADYLEPFDAAMGDIYAARTGISNDEIGDMMDRDTWIGGQAAIDQNFADALLPSDAIEEGEPASQMAAARKIDIALAKAGMPRSERRKLVQDLKSGTPSAAGGGTQNATATDTPCAILDGVQSLPTVSFLLPS